MRFFRSFLFFLVCLSCLISCSSENSPPQSFSETPLEASFTIVFRGQTQALENIEGLSVGDHIRLDVNTLGNTGIVNWRSLNPALGDFTNPGDLEIKEEGRFLIEARVGSLVKQIPITAFPNPSRSDSSCGDGLCEEVEETRCNQDCLGIRSPLNLEAPASITSDPFVDEVVSYHLGNGGGLGMREMPNIVLGAPHGAGLGFGSTDTFSLGEHGSIILRSETPILNGDGVDFIVFENAFYPGGNSTLTPFYELGRVSVSQDGVQFYPFICRKYNNPLRFQNCAGYHPVFSHLDSPIHHSFAPYFSHSVNEISPIDPNTAGGDPFDLEDLGLNWISYIKIEDLASQGELGASAMASGFDLDAISIIHQ